MESNETWLPVAGYENYEVSNLGRVRSVARGGTKGGVLRPQKNRGGYLDVTLCKNGKRKGCTIHRLVATAFLENPLNLPQVNHKNECKTDNRVENLEWCTAEYNSNYGTHIQRVADALSIPVFQYDLNGAFVAWYPSGKEAERRTGVRCGAIAQCANGRCKTQGGYQWRYEPALFLDATDGAFNNTLSKHVFQYSLDGRFVKEWPSVMEIERQTGWGQGNTSRCARGERKSSHGFRWFYSFQGYSLK